MLKKSPFLKTLFLALILGALLLTPLVHAEGGVDTGTNYGKFWNIGCQDIGSCIDLFIDAILVIAFPIAVIFIVFSGFKFVTAQGNPSEITKARQALVWTLIGLALVIGAKALSAAFQQFFIQGS